MKHKKSTHSGSNRYFWIRPEAPTFFRQVIPGVRVYTSLVSDETTFFSGFPLDYTEMDLAKLIGPHGDIAIIKIVRDRQTGKCKGLLS